MELIYGVDYSLSCPCICRLSNNGKFIDSKFKFLSNRKRDISSSKLNIQCEFHKLYKTDQERYDHISNTMIQFIETEQKDLIDEIFVFIEGYAMGAKGLVFNIAECTGIFKHKIHQHHWKLITVPPTVIKQFATGKGNSNKEKMYQAFLSRGNPDIIKQYFCKDVKVTNPVSDIVDAYFIALWGKTQVINNKEISKKKI